MIDHLDRTATEPAAAHARWRPALALAATAVMFAMVTKGPVYWVRLEAASLSGDFIDDPWVQTVFVGIAAVVIVLAWPGRRVLLRDRYVLVAFGAFTALVLLSTVWSVTPSRTFEQAVMLMLGTTAGLLAGAWLDRTGVLFALWTAMQVGVAASVWADVRDWTGSIDKNGDLAGIYFNRNSLGPVALAGAASSVALLVVLRQSARRQEPAFVVAAVAVAFAAAVDVAVTWRSGSLTPAFGVLVATIAVVLLALWLPGPRAVLRRRLAIVLGAGVVAAVVLAVAGRSLLTAQLGRSPTFSGRTTIWDVVGEFVAERPLHGWGFMAMWRQPEIVQALADRGRRGIFEAHSGYMEVLLGVGLLGLGALLAVIVVSAQRTALVAWRRPGVLELWSFGVVAYAVGVNVGETYVGANLLPWVLLAVVAGQAVASLDRTRAEVPVDVEHNATNSAGAPSGPSGTTSPRPTRSVREIEGAHD